MAAQTYESTRDYLMDLAFRGFQARAVHVAAELGIADSLAAGPKPVAILAEEVSADELSLYRLLRALAGLGIFREVGHRVFALSEAAVYLRSDADRTARDAVRVVGRLFHEPCSRLLEAVRSGRPSFDLVFGAPFFDYLDANLEDRALFDSGMSSHSGPENLVIPEAFDFSVFSHVVDVGGGKGGLLAEILRRCPSLEGTLFDLPTTIKVTDLLKPYREQDRCRLVAGDMFDRVPADADCYVLKRVLHDWDDAACTRILHNCAAAMRGDGRVVVIEGIVPEGNEPHPQKEGDLVMMVLLRGRERTLAEFEELFRAASLHLDEVVPLPSGHSILLGRRP